MYFLILLCTCSYNTCTCKTFPEESYNSYIKFSLHIVKQTREMENEFLLSKLHELIIHCICQFKSYGEAMVCFWKMSLGIGDVSRVVRAFTLHFLCLLNFK